MSKPPHFARPSFDLAIGAWKEILAQSQFPTDLIWIFDENLCFEKSLAGGNDYRLSYQTRITPPPQDAEHVAFDYLASFNARLVLYRLGSSHGKSVCLMLCDEWFENKTEKDGFIRKDDWLISFHPGDAQEVEEITDEPRWAARILRDRPLHDLDFSMTLRGIHEMLAHGRVLTSYEHYALRFLGAWRRFMGESR